MSILMTRGTCFRCACLGPCTPLLSARLPAALHEAPDGPAHGVHRNHPEGGQQGLCARAPGARGQRCLKLNTDTVHRDSVPATSRRSLSPSSGSRHCGVTSRRRAPVGAWVRPYVNDEKSYPLQVVARGAEDGTPVPIVPQEATLSSKGISQAQQLWAPVGNANARQCAPPAYAHATREHKLIRSGSSLERH